MDRNTTKIAVIGMGQGGMVAAIKLAGAGAKVTVFERNLEGQVGYTWRDDITASVFDDCGLPRPNMDV
ncbi:MAG: FAD-binding protein, partial [Clostridia bacterium]|nr:FAD-binding protein [Clostridia bacterium]